MRHAVVAGAFYPDRAEELHNMIADFLDTASQFTEKFHAFIVPHAGYIYSGPTASIAYKNIFSSTKRIIILAPPHYGMFEGVSVNDQDYQTPLGIVKVDKETVDLLRKDGLPTMRAAHMQEHSIEVQLPFLQSVLKDFKIVPILLGNIDYNKLATIINKYIDEYTIVMASSDLSHYHPYDDAIKLDKSAIDAVIQGDIKKLKKEEACGSAAIETLLWIAKERGWKAKLLDYKNSGDTAGDKNKVVGYCAVGFYG